MIKTSILYWGSLLLVLFITACNTAQEVVEMSDARPQRNETLTITYNPTVEGAKIPDTVSSLNLQFTYGNLYELPYVLPMEKQGDHWQATLELPRYVTFATFVFKSGDFTDQPSDTAHYELYIYDGERPIENTYLYRGYSLSAQMPKFDSLAYRQADMYQKELELYPENYEAQIRLLNHKIHNGTPEQAKQAYSEAMQVIDAKFHSDPTFGGNVNKVTMGYLILGERSRVDSVREVVLQQYPHSALAKEYLASKLRDEPDGEKRKTRLLASLEDRTPDNASGYGPIYELLFDYYAEKKDAEHARTYAEFVVQDTTPYRMQTLHNTAEKLADNGILLKEALSYVQQAYAGAEEYPIGIIRYFPETGYIPSYVEDKAEKTEAVRGNLKALEGRILDLLGRKDEARKAMELAAEKVTEKETRLQVARYFQANSEPQKAFDLYKEVYLQSPMDTQVQASLKSTYQALPDKAGSFESVRADLEETWKGKMKTELQGKMIKKPLPAMKQIVDLQGNAVDVTALKGKVLVIDFWATWCVPCLASFPYMQKVYERYQDRQDVAFLIVNTGSNNTLEDAQNWKQKSAYTFPVYYNGDSDMLADFGVNMIPASFVVDKNHQIRFSTLGFEGEILEAKLDLMLELVLQD